MVTRNYTGSSKTNLTNLLTKNNEPDTDFIKLIKKLGILKVKSNQKQDTLLATNHDQNCRVRS